MDNSGIEYTKSVTINPAVYGSYKISQESAEDHGAYYLYTPGEPIHRVDMRDSVPHLYPGVVTSCTSWGHWLPASTVDIGSNIITNNLAGEKQILVPKYAGTIKAEILASYGRLGTICIDAFTRATPETLKLDWFNRHLMPVPIFYGDDDVPQELAGWYKDYEAGNEREKLVSQYGGLLARRVLAEAFLQQLINGEFADEIGGQLRAIYVTAVRQILSTFDTFRVFGEGLLMSSDQAVKDRENSGKSLYDGRDVRLQWLLKKKGVDAPLVDIMNQQQPIIQVMQPEAKQDVERKDCPECGELIAVSAKVCRFCQTRFEAKPEAKAEVKAEAPKRKAVTKAAEPLTDEPLL